MDSIIYQFQDKHIDLKKVIEAIKAFGGTVRDEFNAWTAETLMHGRVAQSDIRWLLNADGTLKRVDELPEEVAAELVKMPLTSLLMWLAAWLMHKPMFQRANFRRGIQAGIQKMHRCDQANNAKQNKAASQTEAASRDVGFQGSVLSSKPATSHELTPTSLLPVDSSAVGV
jgi:hypothetical protein